MSNRISRLALPLAWASLLVLGSAGCGSKNNAIVAPKSNVRPTLELTRAPYNQSTRFEYSYRMNWLGYDPDGRVDYFLYAIDPPAATPANPEPDTTWIQTTKSERVINFSATQPDPTVPNDKGFQDFHTFVVKAIDNGGLQSAPLIRSFFTSTIAPTCTIDNPVPQDGARTYVTPSVRISWSGTDEDGIFDSKKPVKYKYILLNANSPVSFATAYQFPDSVRKYWAPKNWAGWDSTTADTTTVQFKDLIPGADYMFCVISFDEAGAYSPIFNMRTNMLNMRISYAAVGGPKLTLFNEFFFFQYSSGFFSNAPTQWIPLEIPANEPVTFNWIGEAVVGADVKSYRWALDIDDVTDLSSRTNERTDLRHYSTESALTTSATVGPFAGGEDHFFYVLAEDNNGLRSLGIVHFSVVQSSLASPLGIVEDARLVLDGKSPSTTLCIDRPKGSWPQQAELDTFLFARGWAQYKCYPAGNLSRPGLFNGYQFDTIGTRNGQSEVRVPLAVIGNYAHLVWITDGKGAQNTGPGTDPSGPICAIRYMSQPGKANSVGAYIKQGGEVWFVGGGIAAATMQPYNKRNNDGTQGTIYSNTNGELIQGRLMYDLVHWRSEIRLASAPLFFDRFLGRFDSLGATPDVNYRLLPTTMRPKLLAYGDTFPQNRTVNPGDFYKTSFDVEYLSLLNYIQEDLDPSPFVDDEESTLDTLFLVRGTSVVQPQFNRYNVCMTRYTGFESKRPVIFTGFNIWSFTRADCQSVVDAVMNWWGLPKTIPATSNRLRPMAGAATPWSPSARAARGVPPGAGTATSARVTGR